MMLNYEQDFLTFIYKKTGILLQEHQLPSFRKQILIACDKFNYTSEEHYLFALQQEIVSEEEFNVLMSAITVGETYFFRYPNQIEFLGQYWLAKQIQQKEKSACKSFYIWSAGCSTGEEIYSLAILFDQHLNDTTQWNINLLATDINRSNLEKASKATYEERALRNLSETLISRYFDKVGFKYKLKSFILKKVTFAYVNLNEITLPVGYQKPASFDLILCNNVFIYFDQVVIKKIMLDFKALLHRDGCLLLAPADITIAHKLTVDLTLKQWKILNYFQRTVIDSQKKLLKTVASQENKLSSQIKPVIRRDSQITKPSRLTHSIIKTNKQSPPTELIIEIKTAISQHAWSQVLILTDKALLTYQKQAVFWQYKAQALVRLGDIEAALTASLEAINYEKVEPYPFFFHAMLQLDHNNVTLGQQFFRKALFIEWDYPECHFHLALLLIRINQQKKALKHFNEALNFANKKPAEKILEDDTEITYAQFVDVLEHHITTLKKQL